MRGIAIQKQRRCALLMNDCRITPSANPTYKTTAAEPGDFPFY
jgi:hypothetical protein